MSIGTGFVILLLLAFLAVTVYALVRAFKMGDTVWGIGIIVGWFFGLGFIVAVVYLLAVDRRRSRLT